jgi:hypothetical protein
MAYDNRVIENGVNALREQLRRFYHHLLQVLLEQLQALLRLY